MRQTAFLFAGQVTTAAGVRVAVTVNTTGEARMRTLPWMDEDVLASELSLLARSKSAIL